MKFGELGSFGSNAPQSVRTSRNNGQTTKGNIFLESQGRCMVLDGRLTHPSSRYYRTLLKQQKRTRHMEWLRYRPSVFLAVQPSKIDVNTDSQNGCSVATRWPSTLIHLVASMGNQMAVIFGLPCAITIDLPVCANIDPHVGRPK